ncbi:MAG: IgGFc-binding protein [Polyangiaceae bacterium]
MNGSRLFVSSLRGVIALAACAALLAPACGGEDRSTLSADGGRDGGGISGEGGPSSGCLRCSADLHDVLNCNDELVKHCPDDQACHPDGRCVSPCESAKANKSTIGCDYWSVDPGTDGEADGSCFAAFVANTWTSPVSLTVTYDGKTLDLAGLARIPSGKGGAITYSPLPGGKLPPGEIAILFLADFPSPVPLPTRCPAGVIAGYTQALASSIETAYLKAFHITSSAPVVAYDIFPYGGAQSYISSATLLVPSSAWDTNYIAVDAFQAGGASGGLAQPFIQIAAAEDDTKVTLNPAVPIAGNGSDIAAAPQGQPVVYTLAAGQVLQLKQDSELNGTAIESDKPIGVWGGNSCMNIMVGDTACDSGHQQLFPVKALGHEYVAARHRNRKTTEESPPWRILGAVDGTKLTYEPVMPQGAPVTINSGEIRQFNAPGPFVVKSQDKDHPFYVSGHMTGQSSQGADFGTGDPEFVNVIPPEQFLRSYVFMTDPTMSNTNLVIVRKKGQDGAFHAVSLDCAGDLGGFQPVGTAGDYELARYDLVLNGAENGLCGNGRHEIHSEAPFGLTVWGWDITVSYAYPAGASVLPINTVVVPTKPK